MAVKFCVCPVCTEALEGETLTLTGGGGMVTVIVAEALLLGSVLDVAINVTVAGLGGRRGAV